MQLYEIIEHTADIGIRAWGRDPRELFTHMAQGMFSLVVPPEAVREAQALEVRASAQGWEALLMVWLKDLLYLRDTRHFIGKRFEIRRLSEDRVEATVWGEPLDLQRHPVDKELKAVTYCEYRVRQESDCTWRAQVIFDI